MKASLHAGLTLVALLLLSSCSSGSNIRMVDQIQGVDPEWGYPTSEARMEVNGYVDFDARAWVRKSGWVRTSVTVNNSDTEPVRVLYRSCPVQIQVYTDEKLQGTPVWDSFAGRQACDALFKQRTLEPMEDTRLGAEFPADMILGDSLAPGTYYFAAIVRPNGVRVMVPAGAVELKRPEQDG